MSDTYTYLTPKEREYQDKVLALLDNELKYKYLGNFLYHQNAHARPDGVQNKPIIEEELKGYLREAGYTEMQVTNAYEMLKSKAYLGGKNIGALLKTNNDFYDFLIDGAKCKPSLEKNEENVYFINFDEWAKNRLRERDIRKIVDTWNAQEAVPHFAKLATWEEIEKNDYNLNIPRYIVPKDTEIKQDIEAHLKGGLPKHDIDQMEDIWAVCPSLKAALFTERKDGRFDLATGKDQVRATVESEASFRKQAETFSDTLKAWASEVRPKMLSVAEGCSPKALIAEWSQLLLDKAKADSSLVDAYGVYDHLMNYWTETMQDDCYMVSNDGWKVELNETKKNPSFKELVCDLLPVPIVVDTYYSTKLAEVQQWEQEIEKKQGELESLVEDNAEVFDMEKVNEANVKKAEKATTEPKANAVLKEYLKLTTEKKEADGKAKKAIAELTKKVREKYTKLTVNEVREMVVIKKWLATVTGRCEDEMQRVTQDIAASVTALAERYERTLGEMETSASDLEKRVNDHLKKMGFEV